MYTAREKVVPAGEEVLNPAGTVLRSEPTTNLPELTQEGKEETSCAGLWSYEMRWL